MGPESLESAKKSPADCPRGFFWASAVANTQKKGE